MKHGIVREAAVATFPPLRRKVAGFSIKHNTFERPFDGNFGHKTNGSAREEPTESPLDLSQINGKISGELLVIMANQRVNC